MSCLLVEPVGTVGRAVLIADVTVDGDVVVVPGWGRLEQTDGGWRATAMVAVAVAGVGTTTVAVDVTTVAPDPAEEGDGRVVCPACGGDGLAEDGAARRCRLCWLDGTVALQETCDLPQLAASGRASDPVLRPLPPTGPAEPGSAASDATTRVGQLMGRMAA